jgi:hypothetical protein
LQAEAQLAYWMMHPNELKEAPEAIEFVESIRRPTQQEYLEFLFFRYRMNDSHWQRKTVGFRLGRSLF